MPMTDEHIKLVAAAQNGDTKSFEKLYDIYHQKVYALARMILRNSGDAEDVLQETFIKAWSSLKTLETPATFSVWIQKIAKNLCASQLRRKNLVILLDAEKDIENFGMEESDELFPSVYAERADLKERLGRIIDGLSDVQRQALVLYYFNELSVDEISEIMECSPNTVKTRLFLARKAIRTEIEEQERKTGQKFYGIAGIPMLPFGKLILSHMESLSISQSAATASLSAVTDSIANGTGTTPPATEASGPASEAPSPAQSPGTSAVGTTGKTMSLASKVMIGIAAVAVIGSGITAAVLLSNGGNDTPGVISDPPGISSTAPGDTSTPTNNNPGGVGWPDNEFTRLLPTPDFPVSGTNTLSSQFSANFEEATTEQLRNYAERLKEAGFTVGLNEIDTDFQATNAGGYDVWLKIEDRSLTLRAPR